MFKTLSRTAKVLVVLASVLLVLTLALVLFVSPICKYLIEKYSVQYTGRQIRMDKLNINIFTGNVVFRGLTIQEAQGKEVFVQVDRLGLNFTLYKLWAGQYELTEVLAEKPLVYVRQKGDHFNYDDLMARFLGEDSTAAPTPSAPVKYWVRNIHAVAGQLVYTNNKPLNTITLQQIDFKLPLVAWNDSLYHMEAAGKLLTGGGLRGKLRLNANSLAYQLGLQAEGLNLVLLSPYLRDYLKVKSLEGLVDAQLQLTGNFNAPTALAASGQIKAHRFALVDPTGELLSAIDETTVLVDTLNTAKNLYRFDRIALEHPFVRVSMYDKGFNYERIMTTPLQASGDTSSLVYSNVFLMLSAYVQDIVKMYDMNNYRVERFEVDRGQCIFTDYTHGEKFRYALDDLKMEADKLSSSNAFLQFGVKARLNTSGKLQGVLKVNPRDYRDIIIDASVRELQITDFNPYSKYYVATPFLKGTITYVNQTTVIGGKLDSKNVLDVQQIKTGKKVKNSTAMNLPVPLAVSLLKDVKGNIHLDIPVKGSLDDPKFKWGKVVWEVVKNLIVKAVTAPFRLLANLFGGKEEEYKEIPFNYVQVSVGPDQQKILDRLAKPLLSNPEMKLELVQVTNLSDEAEATAVFLAKRQYLNLPESMPRPLARQKADSVQNNDPLFLAFLLKQPGVVPGLQSTEEKCVQLVGQARLQPLVQQYMRERNENVQQYLLTQKQVPADRLLIRNAPADNQLQKSAPPKFVVNIAQKE